MPEEATETGAKVATEHEEANRAIGSLREIAVMLKAVGDENVELDKRCDDLQRTLDETIAHGAHVQAQAELLESWTDVIEDYRRGILDRGELFDRTIGGLLL